ncbi:uncharacterized protein EV422DRAFT_507231 [Fimicolochytrium jonesii]|uniref:uncharacterized protein n=1 Tax=Fimicolochytrium jonesii TaxID=1396493 RepID=UPI0022FDDB7E|nr:uncharacterized protein EV422DRAFT_507231 [Fimicolochytrium jonesii]KAI8819581.1 hypothetical protein EV422DRAFT_507231 [Fimicolochytrium jonesii]
MLTKPLTLNIVLHTTTTINPSNRLPAPVSFTLTIPTPATTAVADLPQLCASWKADGETDIGKGTQGDREGETIRVWNSHGSVVLGMYMVGEAFGDGEVVYVGGGGVEDGLGRGANGSQTPQTNKHRSVERKRKRNAADDDSDTGPTIGVSNGTNRRKRRGRKGSRETRLGRDAPPRRDNGTPGSREVSEESRVEGRKRKRNHGSNEECTGTTTVMQEPAPTSNSRQMKKQKQTAAMPSNAVISEPTPFALSSPMSVTDVVGVQKKKKANRRGAKRKKGNTSLPILSNIQPETMPADSSRFIQPLPSVLNAFQPLTPTRSRSPSTVSSPTTSSLIDDFDEPPTPPSPSIPDTTLFHLPTASQDTAMLDNQLSLRTYLDTGEVGDGEVSSQEERGLAFEMEGLLGMGVNLPVLTKERGQVETIGRGRPEKGRDVWMPW